MHPARLPCHLFDHDFSLLHLPSLRAQFVDDHRGGKIVVELNGRLNKCGVISPRYDISHHDVEAWVARLLPSRQFGVIVLTTSSGIMDHEEARRKGVGGKVLGFFY
jgi:small subunit ribosomal protein S15Ae